MTQKHMAQRDKEEEMLTQKHMAQRDTEAEMQTQNTRRREIQRQKC